MLHQQRNGHFRGVGGGITDTELSMEERSFITENHHMVKEYLQMRRLYIVYEVPVFIGHSVRKGKPVRSRNLCIKTRRMDAPSLLFHLVSYG